MKIIHSSPLYTAPLAAALAIITLAACSKADTPEAAAATATEIVEETDPQRKVEKPSDEGEHSVHAIIARGTFTGLSDHITTGDVAIALTDDGFTLTLGENFSLDGAPDPTLAFGNGEYVASTNFTKLNKITGKQAYIIPASIDPTIYSQVYVWCEQHNVALGVASLKVVDTSEAIDDTYGS